MLKDISQREGIMLKDISLELVGDNIYVTFSISEDFGATIGYYESISKNLGGFFDDLIKNVKSLDKIILDNEYTKQNSKKTNAINSIRSFLIENKPLIYAYVDVIPKLKYGLDEMYKTVDKCLVRIEEVNDNSELDLANLLKEIVLKDVNLAISTVQNIIDDMKDIKKRGTRLLKDSKAVVYVSPDESNGSRFNIDIDFPSALTNRVQELNQAEFSNVLRKSLVSEVLRHLELDNLSAKIERLESAVRPFNGGFPQYGTEIDVIKFIDGANYITKSYSTLTETPDVIKIHIYKQSKTLNAIENFIIRDILKTRGMIQKKIAQINEQLNPELARNLLLRLDSMSVSEFIDSTKSDLRELLQAEFDRSESTSAKVANKDLTFLDAKNIGGETYKLYKNMSIIKFRSILSLFDGREVNRRTKINLNLNSLKNNTQSAIITSDDIPQMMSLDVDKYYENIDSRKQTYIASHVLANIAGRDISFIFNLQLHNLSGWCRPEKIRGAFNLS
jgi:hypothetical protein